MKQFILLTFLVLNLGASVVYSFPQVTDWVNAPTVVFENKKQAVLQKDLMLKSPFVVVTGEKDQLGFKVNIFDNITVYPKTKVQIVDFANELGFVSDFYILDGTVRFASTHRGVEKKDLYITLKTPFFDIKATGVYDFVIDLNMKEPSVEVKVISGILPLEFFSYEKSLLLKAGEKAKFNGVMSDDGTGIKYDFLLNQRKAPKGTLLDTVKFDQSAFIIEEKKLEQTEQQKKQEIKKKAEAKIKKRKEYEALM